MTRRPDKFRLADIDDEFLGKLRANIKAGAAPTVAAKALGVPRRRFLAWLEEGLDEIEAAYDDGARDTFVPTRQAVLWQTVAEASGMLAVELAGNVKAGHEAAQHHRWLLERLERDDFGATERIDVTVGGKDGAPIAVEGRALVGIGDVLRFLSDAGQGHLLDAGGGAARGALPAAGDVLPDSPAGELAAGELPAA